MNLLCGHDASVAAWVSARIPYAYGERFETSVAIGVIDGQDLIAGVVYHDWNPNYRTMQVSMAASSARWARRGVIRALLSYPFEQAGAQKLWAMMAASNERALRFNLGIGFKREAVLARHFGADHAVVTRMFQRDFERIYGERQHGQIRTKAAANA